MKAEEELDSYELAVLRMYANPLCEKCEGKGYVTVYETVPYGDTYADCPSGDEACSCIQIGLLGVRFSYWETETRK